MLQQYLELKRQVEDALLLYRLGDFYELFFEDAELAAPILGIVLTKRRHNEEVSSPMCGIPHHAVASYVGKLLDAGLKVAIAEQVEDPAKAGGLVRRAVIRVLTPGTVTEPELLGDGERRWIAALCDVDDRRAGATFEKFPKAKRYRDFRRMLDELDKQIERVFTEMGEPIKRTTSGSDLMRQLAQATPRLLCSLVHKFGRRDVDDFEAYIKDLQAKPSQTVGKVFVFVD